MRSDKYKQEEPIEEEQPKKKKKVSKDINKELEPDEEKTPNRLLIFLKNILITFVIVIVLFFTYAHFIEPSILKTNEYKIESPNIPDTFNGIKMVHLSDIHYGTTFTKKDIKKLIEEIDKINPDIVFFTGDLINKDIELNEEEQKEITDLLKEIKPSLNKYAVLGDEDNTKTKDILNNAGFKTLENEPNLLYYKGTIPIEIVGFNNDKDIDYSIINNEAASAYENIYKIILVHNPNQIDDILNYNPDIILSGHNLGGTINIKGIRKGFIKEQKYDKTYYHINNTEIYISNGLGTSHIQLRVNNVPSINFYRLYKTS